MTQTAYSRDWLRRNAGRRMSDLWAQHDPVPDAGCEVPRRIRGREPRTPARPPRGARRKRPPAEVVDFAAARPSARSAPPACRERLTFESFVGGPPTNSPSPWPAASASWADGHFNPVFFHGPYGFGKTHLLNAIAWEAAAPRPDRKVVYLTAERFLSTFVRR